MGCALSVRLIGAIEAEQNPERPLSATATEICSFVNVQANKSGMFHEVRLLCMRPCAGQPA
jgi:hypothetical protein